MSKFSASRKGDLAEHMAICWALQEGYEVFHNTCCSGPIDIVLIDRSGKIIFVDVTGISFNRNSDTHNYHISGKGTLSQQAIELNVKSIYVNLEYGVVDWELNTFQKLCNDKNKEYA